MRSNEIFANLTSDQVGQKLDFGLPTNLVGGYFLFPTSCREVDFRNFAHVGPNYFLTVDISLENVLTGRKNFSATVDFRSL